MLKHAILKLTKFNDSNLDDQIRQIIAGLDCWLGIRDSDPATTNWGTGDFYIWVNNADSSNKVIKMWDGDAVRTIDIT